MKTLREAMDDGARAFAPFGGICSGKSVMSAYIRDQYGCQEVSVREHYRNFIVPRYLAAHDMDPETPFSKPLTFDAGNWIYSQGKHTYIDAFLDDMEVEGDGLILDGLRLQQDFAHLFERYGWKVKAMILSLDMDERVKRYSRRNDITPKEARSRIEYEWTQYDLAKTQAYLLQRGAAVINTGWDIAYIQDLLKAPFDEFFGSH